ncbi:hypothetical protein Bca52824_085841 [Brassica carinata]|uniref:Uncharacterized protein n=1 Tax=Brassica carinata TaxID=52824 RepID=A0A8X7P8I3_BRACI|nr:hypothetical protein Bca52824_085841 [Brassica carinata]
MGEPNRKPFLGHKPIILNPKAPLHSLKVRERDACQDPHCEGPRITRLPCVDRTTIERHAAERSKPHLFTKINHRRHNPRNPPKSHAHFRQIKEKATKTPPRAQTR